MWVSSVSPIFQRFCMQSVKSAVNVSYFQPARTCLQNNVGIYTNILGSVKLDNLWSFNPVRSVVRCHFPYPKETKRVRCHGYKKRMSTKSGRAIIMRRILKGRHILSH